MDTIHHALAAVLAALAIVVGVLAGLGIARGSLAIRWIDAAIGLLELVVLAGIATGLARFLTTGGPSDGLHPLYAAVAILALPIARFWRGVGPPPSAVYLLVGAIVVLGVSIRLVQTG